jgi:hypothetical protein
LLEERLLARKFILESRKELRGGGGGGGGIVG